MDASEYRAEYTAFSRDTERVRHGLYVAGHDEPAETVVELSRIEERYSDLHKPEAAVDLRQALNATPAQFETERSGLSRLITHARLRWINRRAQDVTKELNQCFEQHNIRFQNEHIPLARVPSIISNESSAAPRREMLARWLDEQSACDDMRLSLRRARDEGATKQGFTSYAAFRQKSAADDQTLQNLIPLAQDYLDRTAHAFHQQLPSHLVGVLNVDDVRQPSYAESLRLERLPHLDAYFPAGGVFSTCEAFLNTFKLGSTAQEGLHLHALAHGTETAGGASAFALDPPMNVRLEVRIAAGGAGSYRAWLVAAGRAQHFAWSSVELRVRYPEFVCPSGDDGTTDDVTRYGHAELFASLLHDASWLSEHRSLRIEEARRVAHTIGFADVARVRRAAAGVVARALITKQNDAQGEEQAEEYAALMSDATGFIYDPRLYIAEVCGESDPAKELRAHLFASSMRDGLLTRYGSRWWAHKGARDELIDMWNTGTRYSIEELAHLASGSTPDAGALAETHLELMRGGVRI